jgi:hypothetical protein
MLLPKWSVINVFVVLDEVPEVLLQRCPFCDSEEADGKCFNWNGRVPN